MKHHKIIITVATILFATFFSVQLFAQQSNIDSVVTMLNKSIKNNKADSAIFNKADKLLRQNTSSLSTKQIQQLEQALNPFKKWENEGWPSEFRLTVLENLKNKENFDEAIKYGKSQIEQLDQYHNAEASHVKSGFLRQLRFPFRNSNKLDDGLLYFSQKLNEYKSTNDSLAIASCYFVLSGFYKISGLTDLAIYNLKKSLSYNDSIKYKNSWLNDTGVLGWYYLSINNKSEGLKFSDIALKGLEKIKIKRDSVNPTSNIAGYITMMMLKNNQTDSVPYYLNMAKKYSLISDPDQVASILQIEACYFIQIGELAKAEKNLIECWRMIQSNNIQTNGTSGATHPDYYLALIRIKQNKYNEAIELLKKDIIRLNNNREDILKDYKLMGEIYQKTGQSTLAAETYSRFIALQENLIADQNKYRSLSFEVEQQISDNENAISKLKSENKISSLTRNFSIGLAVLLLLLISGVYYRFQSKKKANEVLNNALENLKATQSQLIQSEKMASLGELTAGIAHEIQNPLNFVNNFSEVSTEMIDEMNEEIDKGDLKEAKAISNDLKQNLEKISHHGNRASSIVKGMLEHSRTSSGQKELTDINALADEYLKLTYHGLRAKDKKFNANFETHFDEKLPTVAIIPQDIGRVLLNLINNAFYAVNEKQQTESLKQNAENYKPMVTISTKNSNGKAVITISDNGNGIPQNIIDKIFQPFFTTKPTGQGTGLGLSLSYDIVKAHNGELKVETKEGEGSEFIITLPIK
jgi:signal transduction histidine kinase